MQVRTIPVFRWFYCDNTVWSPYTEKESEELERIYSINNGRVAYYLEEDRLVDFCRRQEISKKRPDRMVIRGTWFFEDDNQTLIPYSEDISKVLETAYQTTFESGNFQKCKVSDQPLRLVDKNADGTYRQYRYTKNGGILGRKVLRGYNGLVLPVDDSSAPEPKAPRTPSYFPGNTSSPPFLTSTTTAMPVRLVASHPETISQQNTERKQSSTPVTKTSTSAIQEISTSSSRMATATRTAATRMPAVTTRTGKKDCEMTSPLTSPRGGPLNFSYSRDPYSPRPDVVVPCSPRGGPDGSLSPRGGLGGSLSPIGGSLRGGGPDGSLSPRGGPVRGNPDGSFSPRDVAIGPNGAACRLPSSTLSPKPTANATRTVTNRATRTQTLAAKEKLVELGKQLTARGTTPHALQTEADLRLIVQRLQEENSQLKTKCNFLERKVADLEILLPQTEAEIEELGKQTDEIANALLDREDELGEKNLLVEKLLDKIRRITGQDEVYVSEGCGVEEEGGLTEKALRSIVDVYDQGMGDMVVGTIQDIIRDFSLEEEDLDQLLNEI